MYLYSLFVCFGFIKGSLGGGFVGRLRRGRTLVPHFTRNVNDWELEVVENFFSTLRVKTIRREVNDKVIWKDGEKDCFVSNAAFGGEVSPFPKKHHLEPMGPL